tara:strand:- start:400 stop:735 length:336 start_codon:yes stop_codon:yes gene_type:complete
MPHIIIEHDSKIKSEVDLSILADTLHSSLAAQKTVKLEALKTRTIEVENVLIGNNDMPNKMIHITVLLLAGRSDELKEKMAKSLFDKTKELLDGFSCSITVNIDELATYIK